MKYEEQNCDQRRVDEIEGGSLTGAAQESL